MSTHEHLELFETALEFPEEYLEDPFFEGLPNDLRHFWDTYGLGLFDKGYLRANDPLKLNSHFSRLSRLVDLDNHIPILSTAYGDVITYDREGTYYSWDLLKGRVAPCGVRFDLLLKDLHEEFFLRELFTPAKDFDEAVAHFGAPSVNKVFVRDGENNTTGQELFAEFTARNDVWLKLE